MDTDQIGKRAALLSAVEIGLGSLLHGLHVPLAGHVLSLNQGFILSRAHLELQDKRAGGMISTTAALLKSLSPAGKKLTPMLAIALQGQLFGLGPLVLGTNRPGLILGMWLLSLWGIVQPLLFYTLVFGEKLWGMALFYLKQLQEVVPLTQEQVLGALIALVLIKFAIGAMLVELSCRLKGEQLKRYETWAIARAKEKAPRPQSNIWWEALRDLFSPFYLFTLVLMAVFYFFAQSEHAEFVWVMLRPIAIGYLLMLGLRLMPLDWVIQRLERRSPRLAQSLGSALKHLGRTRP